MQMVNRYNNHINAPPTYGMWRKPITERNWRNGKENYGNVKAVNGGTRFGKIRKKRQFQNRNNNMSLWNRSCYKDMNVNKFHGGGDVRFHPYAVNKEKGVEADADLSSSCVVWSEVEEWGLDVYGTMSGLIRLKSDCGEGGTSSSSSCIDEDEDDVQFEKRLDCELSKYEMVLPKSLNGVGSDLKSEGEVRSVRLENENLMLKQSLFVMDRDMDDLKRRMEAVEMLFRVKGGAKVESVTKASLDISEAIVGPKMCKPADESDDNQQDGKRIGGTA